MPLEQLKEIWNKNILPYKFVYLFIHIVIFGISFYLFVRSQKIYTSSAKILIDTNRKQFYEPPQGAGSRPANRRENLFHFITGTVFLEHVSQNLKNDSKIEMGPSQLKASIRVQPFKDSDTYGVQCDGKTPHIASRICEHYLMSIETVLRSFAIETYQSDVAFISGELNKVVAKKIKSIEQELTPMAKMSENKRNELISEIQGARDNLEKEYISALHKNNQANLRNIMGGHFGVYRVENPIQPLAPVTPVPSKFVFGAISISLFSSLMIWIFLSLGVGQFFRILPEKNTSGNLLLLDSETNQKV